MEKKIATQDDWRNRPLPEKYTSIEWQKVFSAEEFEKIVQGLIPENMEENWFIYYEEPWLCIHRSWTGFCIFRVRFEPTDRGIEAVEILANREPEQYASLGDSSDLGIVRSLIRMLLGIPF